MLGVWVFTDEFRALLKQNFKPVVIAVAIWLSGFVVFRLEAQTPNPPISIAKTSDMCAITEGKDTVLWLQRKDGSCRLRDLFPRLVTTKDLRTIKRQPFVVVRRNDGLFSSTFGNPKTLNTANDRTDNILLMDPVEEFRDRSGIMYHSFPNDKSNPPVQFKAACRVTRGGQLLVGLCHSQEGYAGICLQNCSDLGAARIAFRGTIPLIMDGPASFNHVVALSRTVMGDGHDVSNSPNGAFLIGSVTKGSDGIGGVAMVMLAADE